MEPSRVYLTSYPTLDPAPEPHQTLRRRMWHHDANEAPRTLRQHKRFAVRWCWFWFSWTFGAGFDVYPETDDDRATFWFAVGPFAVDVMWRRGGAAHA